MYSLSLTGHTTAVGSIDLKKENSATDTAACDIKPCVLKNMPGIGNHCKISICAFSLKGITMTLNAACYAGKIFFP